MGSLLPARLQWHGCHLWAATCTTSRHCPADWPTGGIGGDHSGPRRQLEKEEKETESWHEKLNLHLCCKHSYCFHLKYHLLMQLLQVLRSRICFSSFGCEWRTIRCSSST